MAKQYGKVYFVLGAIPKNPKVFDNVNNAEIFLQKLQYDYCKKNDPNFDGFYFNYFYETTSIKDEMIKLGYDGLVIKGREMVNYTPDNNKIKYFENIRQLEMYFEDFILNESFARKIMKEAEEYWKVNIDTSKIFPVENEKQIKSLLSGKIVARYRVENEFYAIDAYGSFQTLEVGTILDVHYLINSDRKHCIYFDRKGGKYFPSNYRGEDQVDLFETNTIGIF